TKESRLISFGPFYERLAGKSRGLAEILSHDVSIDRLYYQMAESLVLSFNGSFWSPNDLRSTWTSLNLTLPEPQIVSRAPRLLPIQSLIEIRKSTHHGKGHEDLTLISLLSHDIRQKTELYSKRTGVDLTESIKNVLSDGSVESYFKAEAQLEYSVINHSLWKQFDEGRLNFDVMLRASVIQYNHLYKKLVNE
ncbi:MAG: hypothetical protein JRN15_03650, partial [Nitrososphaerota archaeon]|nr:hypothetical protein [Nitrososphaerota archaeon]